MAARPDRDPPAASAFGHFDASQREYVITEPLTPLPWINYLGSKGLHAIVSNTGGGYSFFRDAKLRRLEPHNLAANAQKFSPSGAEIAISLASEDGAVRWTVVDHGPGISDAERARLFERFFVGTSDRQGAGGGAGIGLPTSLAIAQAHGGTIEVESVLGEGSTFHLVVPA